MEPHEPNSPPTQIDFLTRILIWIAGAADKENLKKCSTQHIDNMRALGLLALANLIFETGVLSLAAHRLFAQDGNIHPGLIAGALAAAIFIYLIDSYVFYRSAHWTEGVAALRRAGVNLAGGIFGKIKTAIFLLLRILILCLPLSLLTGIFVGLIIFHPDIAAVIDSGYRVQNADLIKVTTDQVNDQIQATADAAKSEEIHVAALQSQLVAIRAGAVDGLASDPAVQAEQKQVDQLVTEKAQRDSELRDAQSFSSAELAGGTGPNHSGHPGRGPVRRAAEERVKTATESDAAAGRALDAARARLDALRDKAASTSGTRTQEAQSQLPQLEADLQTETAQLATLRANFAKLSDGRDTAIRDAVENAPGHVGRDQGLIAQIQALRQIAQDPEIAAVIVLIDVASFGLEMAAVLAKVMSQTPSTYAALLVRDLLFHLSDIADEMGTKFNEPPQDPPSDGEILPPIPPANGSSPEPGGNGHDSNSPFRFGPLTERPEGDGDPTPPKRPRGRPRKHPPEQVS